MEKSFDVLVIGAGPGGYVAAIRAAQLGLKTAIIEKEHLGGICLNWGCIPTKALLKASEVYHIAKHASDFGIECKEVSFNFEKIIARSREVAKKLAGGISHLLKKNKVTVFNGYGKILGKGKVLVEQQDKTTVELTAKHIIIATGARAKTLPNIEPDHKLIWSYKEAMTPKSLPRSLLIIGSGAIGIEFASFYNMLGVDVTVAEIHEGILHAEDREIAALAQKAFEKRGIKILSNTVIKSLKKNDDSVTVTLNINNKTQDITFDRMISAIGITANIENIGLENTNIKTDKGFIVTDEFMQTHEPNIYAIGDVTSPPWLAHKASHEGVLCVEKIAGLKEVHVLNKKNIPACTYCYPQIASIGLTEEQAKKEGYSLKIGRFPLVGNGKAIAIGETDGLIKTIFDEKTGELLGAHMIGAEVTEMIQGYTIAKTLEATELDLMHTIFPHPTVSESMHESVLDAYKKALHI